MTPNSNHLIILPFDVFPIFSLFFFMYLKCVKSICPYVILPHHTSLGFLWLLAGHVAAWAGRWARRADPPWALGQCRACPPGMAGRRRIGKPPSLGKIKQESIQILRALGHGRRGHVGPILDASVVGQGRCGHARPSPPSGGTGAARPPPPLGWPVMPRAERCPVAGRRGDSSVERRPVVWRRLAAGRRSALGRRPAAGCRLAVLGHERDRE